MNAFGENTVFERENLGSLMAYMSVIELGQGVGVSKSSFHELEYLFSALFGRAHQEFSAVSACVT